MPSLNKIFKEAIIENNYCCSVFDTHRHDINDLQICHILSKSEATKKAIMKAYNCDKNTAEMLTNMPLLNTVVGTRKDNAEYKKTNDIVNINFSLLEIAEDIYCKFATNNLLKIKIFRDIFMKVRYSVNTNHLVNFMLEDIKEIQYRFHKELGIYH